MEVWQWSILRKPLRPNNPRLPKILANTWNRFISWRAQTGSSRNTRTSQLNCLTEIPRACFTQSPYTNHQRIHLNAEHHLVNLFEVEKTQRQMVLWNVGPPDWERPPILLESVQLYYQSSYWRGQKDSRGKKSWLYTGRLLNAAERTLTRRGLNK